MARYFDIIVMDAELYEIASNNEVEGFSNAKDLAKGLLAEHTDAHKVEVRPAGQNHCVYDKFK